MGPHFRAMSKGSQKRVERVMIDWKTIIVIALVAVVFGALMGYRAGVPFGWQRAVISALAFGVLGWLLSYIFARRK
jgi:hypothetical protein